MAKPQPTTAPDIHAANKKQFPGVFIFVRVGDFLETFGDDAETLSRVCGVTITTRKSSPPLKMAGVPSRECGAYLENLIRAGIRVSIVDGYKTETAFLQHGTAPGPFRTESVTVRTLGDGKRQAYFENHWRAIHNGPGGAFIVYQCAPIKITVDTETATA